MNINSPGKRERGFTLIELLITLALLGIVFGLGWPSLQKLLTRNKLETVTRETATLFTIARYEAIKQARPTVVRIVPATKTVEAFVDDDEDGDRTGAEQILRSYDLPALIEFGGPRGEPAPTSNAVLDFSPAPASATTNQVVFEPNGSVRDTGAFRFRELKAGNSSLENYLELRVPARAALRFTVRKWDRGDSKWREQGEEGKNWEWKM